jgi:TetR/AcrR family transcriptional repressor of nem operon
VGCFDLQGSARQEAETFMAMVYGAMLAARAYGDPKVFGDIVASGLARLASPRLRKSDGTRARGAAAGR